MATKVDSIYLLYIIYYYNSGLIKCVLIKCVLFKWSYAIDMYMFYMVSMTQDMYIFFCFLCFIHDFVLFYLMSK